MPAMAPTMPVAVTVVVDEPVTKEMVRMDGAPLVSAHLRSWPGAVEDWPDAPGR
jgi:hypothetical protein